MTKRASLPGAEELFRSTAKQQESEEVPAQGRETPSRPSAVPTSLQVAKETDRPAKPRHDEKITFYCTGADLTRIERARLSLRADHSLASDRGRIVRAALAEILDDFEGRGPNSALVKRLQAGLE